MPWQVHRTPLGLGIFFFIGILAGMFGLGAGWANLPALNLLMGAPLKVSAGTSSFILSLVDSSAAWVYIHKGAVLPMIAVPSVIGMMLGAKIGARLLKVLPAATVRKLVLAPPRLRGAAGAAQGAGNLELNHRKPSRSDKGERRCERINGCWRLPWRPFRGRPSRRPP